MPAAMEALDARWACPGATASLDAQSTAVVRVPDLLTAQEIAEIRALANEVEATDGAAVLDFEADPSEAHRGAWKTVYLHSRGAFQDRLSPAIHAKLWSAVRQADRSQRWRLLSTRCTEHGQHQPSHTGVRNAEVHTVGCGGALPEPDHHGTGSLITIDLMLSGPEEFDGGTFQTLELSGQYQQHEFNSGDALVFCSYKYHGVTPVLRGTRRVFVVEFWAGQDKTCPHRCENRTGASCVPSDGRRDSASVDVSQAGGTGKPKIKVKVRAKRKANTTGLAALVKDSEPAPAPGLREPEPQPAEPEPDLVAI